MLSAVNSKEVLTRFLSIDREKYGIIKDITDRLFYGDDKKLTPTVEVRDMVIEILKKDGYSKVSEAYENYAKNQN